MLFRSPSVTWSAPTEGAAPFGYELHSDAGWIASPVTSPYVWDGTDAGHGAVTPPTPGVSYSLRIKVTNAYEPPGTSGYTTGRAT